MTEVSIIIPSYNQKEYLPESIESAINQTVPCEIIVIDDGSTDNSLELAKMYAETAIHFGHTYKVISQVNKGLASARNTGIMNATGRWILPLDADDILEPLCVQRILEVAKEKDADVIAPSIRCFGVGNALTILMPNPTLEDFKVGNRLAYCSAIKKEVLLEVGGYSPKMVEGYEDLHLWINLLTRGKKIVTIPETLVMYRTKESSMWHDAKKHHSKLMGQIYKDFPSFA